MRDVQLTLGDRVHYRSHGSPILPDGSQVWTPECRAAIAVDDLGGDRWILFVITPTGSFHDTCRYDLTGARGTWHHPGECGFVHG
jgi:hypothetical protein